MIGIAQWALPGEHGNAMASWQDAIEKFEYNRLMADRSNNKEKRDWYTGLIETLNEALAMKQAGEAGHRSGSSVRITQLSIPGCPELFVGGESAATMTVMPSSSKSSDEKQFQPGTSITLPPLMTTGCARTRSASRFFISSNNFFTERALPN